MVFYRKYRPQTIEELDLESVRNKLFSILKSSEIPHAFLFSGPKGLGKTSAARILAKTINCKTNITGSKGKKAEVFVEPCNTCEVCVSITNGSNLDVIEIDAASNRGIDEIRNLREKIKFAPVSLAKKVYIIDEVHMLTSEAFNALLKTLEEPPSHAVFILCTTEPWKLPDTIISRTFQIQFEKPTKNDMLRSLKKVADGENLKVEDSVLDDMLELSSGSFRDAHKIFEELAFSATEKIITGKMLEGIFKVQSYDQEVVKLLKNIAQKNVKEALMVTDRLSKNGADFMVVTEKIVDYLRRLLLKKSGFEEDVDEIKEFNIDILQKLAIDFSASYREIKFAVIPQLPLELVIVKWCVIDEVRREKYEVGSSKLELRSSDSKQEQKEENKKTENVKPASNQDFLKQLIEAVKKDNHSVAGVLRGCKLVEIKENTVVLEAAYKFHKDKLEEKKAKEIIEKNASEILGKEVNIEIRLK